MQYLALATDYDETAAHDGKMDDATLEALRRVPQSGRRKPRWSPQRSRPGSAPPHQPSRCP